MEQEENKAYLGGISERIKEVETKLEMVRKHLKNYINIMIISPSIGFGIFILIAVLAGIGIDANEMPILMPLMIFALICVFVVLPIVLTKYTKLKNVYRKIYKEEFVIRLLEEEFENVYYNWLEGFTKEQIVARQFVRTGSLFKSEDYLTAEYKGVRFKRADVLTGSRKKDEKDDIYFHGRVYEIEFNKKILGGMQIRTKFFPAGITSDMLKSAKDIDTENIEFNKIFDIRTMDEGAAFYVLTPQMQEHILSINKNFKNMCIRIEGSQMFIGANSKVDSFELSARKPVTYENERKRILGELDEIKSIIDELNLMDKKYLELEDGTGNFVTDFERANVNVEKKSIDEMFLGDIG